jgi:hypothetical protein
MKIINQSITLLILLSTIMIPQLHSANRVIDNSGTAGTLQAKWNKAFTTGLKQNKSFWVAYSVDQLMPENRFYISTARMSGSWGISVGSSLPTFEGVALGKLLYGKDASFSIPTPPGGNQPIKEAAKRALANAKNKNRKFTFKKVKREVAVLFLYDLDSNTPAKEPARIAHSNLFFPFDSKDKPIYWLGKTDASSSLQLQQRMFADLDNDKSKRRVLSAIGYHSDSSRVIPFLNKVANSDESDTVRSKAAGEMGDQDDSSAIPLLLNIAKNDHSLEVRRKAVNALEDLDFPAAVDALIDIAKNANNNYIRQKAINNLGDIGTSKAADALNHIAFNDIDTNIQRKAVNALEDLPNKKGVPYLITIAKTHPKPYIRKKAINCLSDIKDPRAVEAITAIAKDNR